MNPKKLVLTGAALAAVLISAAVVLPRGPFQPGHASDEEPGSTKPVQPVAATRPRASAAVPSSAATSASPGAAPNRPSKPAGVLAELAWGAGPDQLGRDRPEEGNPEGPMSLTIDAKGRTLLLDQVNGRILRLDRDGKPEGSIPVPVQAAQDLITTEDGKSLVLDRLADRTVSIMDESGKVIGELPLEGAGIEEPGGVTGVFVDGDDVYVEREHGALVRVGDTRGTPDLERPEIPGRPSRDGKQYLNAGLIDPLSGRFYLSALSRPEQDHLYTREFQLDVSLVGIVALESDVNGTVYTALLVDQAPDFEIRVLCLNGRDGSIVGQTVLPASNLPEESFRDFTALPGGGLLYAYRTESGVQYQQVACR